MHLYKKICPIHSSVRQSICLSVCPSVRPSVNHTFYVLTLLLKALNLKFSICITKSLSLHNFLFNSLFFLLQNNNFWQKLSLKKIKSKVYTWHESPYYTILCWKLIFLFLSFYFHTTSKLYFSYFPSFFYLFIRFQISISLFFLFSFVKSYLFSSDNKIR